jgi:triacylglycerol lipase
MVEPKMSHLHRYRLTKEEEVCLLYVTHHVPYGLYNHPYPFIQQFDDEQITTSIYLAALCYQAYVLYEKKRMVLPTWPSETKLVTRFCGSSGLGISEEAFGYILESPSSIFIVFRGTKTVGDWGSDIYTIMETFSYTRNSGKVHKGFLSVYNSVREDVMEYLQDLDPKKTLYITGHSLGGALATLCTLDVSENTQFKQPVMITFAAPRVGNKAFVEKFDNTIEAAYRIVNSEDYVPVIPPPELGFLHVGRQITITVGGFNPGYRHKVEDAYFLGLAAKDPAYAKALCKENPPGFCPPTYVSKISYVPYTSCVPCMYYQ